MYGVIHRNMLRMKRVNLQHTSYKPVFSKSKIIWILIRQLQRKPAALDPHCYQKGSSRLSLTRLKSYKSIVCPQSNYPKRSINHLAGH